MMALDADLRDILQGLQSELALTIQLNALLPILRSKRLVTQSESQQLSSDGKESDLEKNRKLIRIIIGKGEKAYDLFVEALQEEQDHLGHESLAKKLIDEKKRSKAKSKPRAPEPLPRNKPATSAAPTPPPKPTAKPQQVIS